MKQLILIIACLLLGNNSFAQKQLWGMSRGNSSAAGTIFRTDSSGDNYTDVYTFAAAANGTDPYGSLLEAADGNLYGLTSRGGSFNHGVLFQFNPLTLVYTKIHDFDSVNGKNPYGSLFQASDGYLYGMTHSGGTTKKGVLFRYDISTKLFNKIFDFDMVKGGFPYGSALMEAKDRKLYAVTSAGGGDATGALFQYDPATGLITLKYSFILGAFNSGYDCRGSLIQATDGSLYGFSRFGKPGFESGGGVLFKFDLSATPGDQFIGLHYFDDLPPGSANGYDLMGSLIQATNGKLYGMTNSGGADTAGTIFEYSITDDTLIRLHDFNRTSEGYRPYGSLLQASDGKLYGLISSDSGQARLFRFDLATNTLTITADVTGTPFYTSLIETGRHTSGIAAAEHSSSVRVFPNPARDLLTIDVPGNITINSIAVMDITGKVIHTQTGNNKTVNTRQLHAGHYMLQIMTDQQQPLYHQFVK